MKLSLATSTKRLSTARTHRIWGDRLSLGVVIVTLVVNVICFLVVVAKLRPLSYAVPVRYTSVAGFDTLGPWYALYALPLYGMLVLIANVGLAMRAFSRSRIASFFLLLAATIVALLCLVISIAFMRVV